MTSPVTPAVVGVAVIRPHVMRLLFSDGVVRDIQYIPRHGSGSLLEPLADPEHFARVRVDHEGRTVVWPNGLDLAPEVLHGDHEPNDDHGFQDVTSRQPAKFTKSALRIDGDGRSHRPICRDLTLSA